MANSKESVLPIYIVDAFTKQAFRGNAAAVCTLRYQQLVPHDVKQKIAAEMNLSETAFITVIEENETFEKGKRFALQWFTPTREVPLCGHATLASAAVLFFIFNNPSSKLEFDTSSGLLKAKRLTGGKIEIDLPAYEPRPVDSKLYEAVVKAAIGSLPTEEIVRSESGNLLIRLKDTVTRKQFHEVSPRDDALLSGATDLLGVIVTCKGWDGFRDDEGNQYDFGSRYFAPWFGVSEDPVCGSAHSVLAPFWSNILNKKEFCARMCSTRGGDLYVRLIGKRVAISGDSVIVLRGQLSF